MNKLTQEVTSLVGKVDPQYIRLALVILTLSLLVIGSGAPADGGGSCPGCGG